MTDSVELARLVARLPRAQLRHPAILTEAGRALGIEWPAEYVSESQSPMSPSSPPRDAPRRDGRKGWWCNRVRMPHTD